MQEAFTVGTRARSAMLDITHEVEKIVRQSGIQDGQALVFCPHTTAGLTINENADPAVVEDMLAALDRLVPWQAHYKHSEGNSAAHVKASMMGFTLTVLVRQGRMVLGTWQGIYFCEFDGPRNRTVIVSVR
ncbi:MAG: secondary thiamine-phosphate synthase enzyme YjbQ [Vicinamibacteria bacterium]|jgi:secondary thiamine-phosphate synthase enzyme|nr:secondary thiamine-phosphate synthase enzyme YjbQ [Vicinamibacteria bacterium]